MSTTTKSSDPAIEAAMLLIHRGTTYFLHKINELRDEEFDEPSLLPEWSRRHVIAHVSYNAEGICRLLSWARTGIETPAYASAEARTREIEVGATLDPATLRKLYKDSAARLDRQWRDLPREAWRAEIIVQGRAVPASTTLWRRTREVWLHAVDLNNGAAFTDFPAELIDRLVADVLSTWRQRQSTDNIPNFVLVPGDRDAPRPSATRTPQTRSCCAELHPRSPDGRPGVGAMGCPVHPPAERSPLHLAGSEAPPPAVRLLQASCGSVRAATPTPAATPPRSSSSGKWQATM